MSWIGLQSADGLGFRPARVADVGFGYAAGTRAGLTTRDVGLGASEIDHGVEVFRLLGLVERLTQTLPSIRTCAELYAALAEIGDLVGMIKGNLYLLPERQKIIWGRLQAALGAVRPHRARLMRCLGASQLSGLGAPPPPRMQAREAARAPAAAPPPFISNRDWQREEREREREAMRVADLLETAIERVENANTCEQLAHAIVEAARLYGTLEGHFYGLAHVAGRVRGSRRRPYDFMRSMLSNAQARLARCTAQAPQPVVQYIMQPPAPPAVPAWYPPADPGYGYEAPPSEPPPAAYEDESDLYGLMSALGAAGGADDLRVCDQGAGQIVRLAQVAQRAALPHHQPAVGAILLAWRQLEERRQMGEAVCLEIAALGRRAEQLARFIAAGG